MRAEKLVHNVGRIISILTTSRDKNQIEMYVLLITNMIVLKTVEILRLFVR